MLSTWSDVTCSEALTVCALMIKAMVFVQGEERDIMGALRTYVRDEFKDKRQQEVDTSAWPISCAARQPGSRGHRTLISNPETCQCMHCYVFLHECRLLCICMRRLAGQVPQGHPAPAQRGGLWRVCAHVCRARGARCAVALQRGRHAAAAPQAGRRHRGQQGGLSAAREPLSTSAADDRGARALCEPLFAGASRGSLASFCCAVLELRA